VGPSPAGEGGRAQAARAAHVEELSIPKDKSDHGIVLDEKSQEQPKDKDRARTAQKTDPAQKTDDELQLLREKSGF
jgi:hypothetical protein